MPVKSGAEAAGSAGRRGSRISRAPRQPERQPDQRKTRAVRPSLYAGENNIWAKTKDFQGFAGHSDVGIDSLT